MPRCGLPGQLSLQAPVLLRRPFRLDLIQLLPGLSQLFPGALRFGLRLLVLVLFAPGLLGGAFRLLRLSGILRTALVILLPHAVRRAGFPAVLLKLAAFGLRAIVARRTVLPVSSSSTADVGMVRGRVLPVQPVRGDCPRYPPSGPGL